MYQLYFQAVPKIELYVTETRYKTFVGLNILKTKNLKNKNNCVGFENGLTV